MEENVYYIRTADIKDFFFNNLIKAGLAPEDGDLEVIADIVFDYFIHIGLVQEADTEPDDSDFEDEEQ
jgi:hypothetical protein